MIRFYPRAGQWISRANNCTFRGSNTINTGGNTGTLLHTISGVTAAQWYYVTNINSTEKFRYIWFMSGPSSQGNMTEVEFYTKGYLSADRSLIDDRIAFASTLTAANYTVASWAELQTAFLNATTLPANASQAQVDSAANALKSALAGPILI